MFLSEEPVLVGGGNAAVPRSFTHGPEVPIPFPTVTAAFSHHANIGNPDVVAARDLSSNPPREITYAELSRRARRLAARLTELGVRPGDRIPLVVKRSIEMLVGIFGILYCGAQYVPMDGGVVPDSTLRFVLTPTGGRVAVCLANTEYRIKSVSESCKTVVVDDSLNHPQLEDYWSENKPFQDLATAGSGCYVIYTSGTTGTPKGVDVTHRNVTNLLCLPPGNLKIGPRTRVGSVLNISFDMAAWEVLGCLCNGGTLILRGSDWAAALREVEVLICTPSILSKYNPALYPNIRVVATAGEPSSQSLADAWANHGTYFNCCGPTETTIVNTMDNHVPGRPLSIGKPTPNNIVYILDEDRKQVALGEPGVMWAGGAGVSRGYVGLPEKTAERYLPDPFANDGTKMYNTGDLGRWSPDGSIEILGRVDDQIKIKGFRVELDGVSHSLSSSPTVHRAVALLVNQEIHAFLTPASCDVTAVKEHMKGKQPYYAIPSHFHLMDALPDTANGKIDKKSLRQMVEDAGLDVAALQAAAAPVPASPASSSGSSISSGDKTTVGAGSSTTSLGKSNEKVDLSADIPSKRRRQPFRGLVKRVFIVYRFLFSFIGLANVAALVSIFVLGVNPEWYTTLVAINLCIAVLIRQDFIINLVYTLSCSLPTWLPLFIRARAAKIYHLGGVHSGAAFCAACWLLASNIHGAVCSVRTCGTGFRQQSLAASVVAWILSGGFAVMITFAYPTMRKRTHNAFEAIHRFLGWTMLGLFWVQTVIGVNDLKPANQPLGVACARTPAFWLLLAASVSIAISWLFLRKVPVEAEVLSDHAVRLHFGYTVPVNGSFTRLAHRPLTEWHSFATIPAPEAVGGYPKGYSLVVSNAGDWTKALIRNPPSKIWVRGVPACGVMRIATLFRRLVVVCTGSGIGPVLGHVQNHGCPTQLIWSTPNPEQTFGTRLLASIREKIPNAVIHDTRVLGRPDLTKMAFNLAKGFDAEAVIIIANEKITKKVVYGLETRGVHAYGAIWDS